MRRDRGWGRARLRVGVGVALVAGVGSCHFVRVADEPKSASARSKAIGRAASVAATPTREDRAEPRTRVASTQRVASVATAAPVATPEPEGPRSPAEVAAPPIRTPRVDCTPRREVGYRRGKPLPITTIRIDGDLVETRTADAYWAMRAAAAEDGLSLRIYSGFRTAAEQAFFYRCYECGCCNGGVLAAKPGWSNHQSGRALDLQTSAPGVLPWLRANAARFGFSNTVRSEPWHWEYDGKPRFAAVCRAESTST